MAAAVAPAAAAAVGRTASVMVTSAGRSAVILVFCLSALPGRMAVQIDIPALRELKALRLHIISRSRLCPRGVHAAA